MLASGTPGTTSVRALAADCDGTHARRGDDQMRQQQPGMFGAEHRARRHRGTLRVGRGDEAARRRPRLDQFQFQVEQFERHGPLPRVGVGCVQRRIGGEQQAAASRRHGRVGQQPDLFGRDASGGASRGPSATSCCAKRFVGLRLHGGPDGRAQAGQQRLPADPRRVVGSTPDWCPAAGDRSAAGSPAGCSRAGRSAAGRSAADCRGDRPRGLARPIVAWRSSSASVRSPPKSQARDAIELRAEFRRASVRVRERRTRRRANQPEPQAVGLFQQFRRRQALQPNRVEPQLLQYFQRFAAMLDDPRKHRTAIDQQHRPDQLHRVPRAAEGDVSSAATAGDGHDGRVARVLRRDLWQRARVAMSAAEGGLPSCSRRALAGQFEVVDPDVGRARPAVDVQQHDIEIGFPVVDLRPELHPQDVNLPGQELRDPPSAIAASGRRRCSRCRRRSSSRAGRCGDRSFAARRSGRPIAGPADPT